MIALLALLGLAAAPAGPPPSGNTFVRFAEAPRNLRDAAFSPAGDSFFVVDSQAAAIEVFDLQGRRLRTVKHPGLGELDFNQPGNLVPWKGGFLLESASLHLLWLDAALSPKKGWILPSRGNPPDARDVISDRGPIQEIAVWQAVPLSDEAVILTGDYLDAKGWRHGVARLDGGKPLRLTVLAERKVDDPHYLFELHQRPNLARVGDAVFELRFGESPSVERVFPSSEHVALPKPFDAPLAPLGRLGGRDQYLSLFAKLRSQPLPASIQGRQDSLYLLTWTPQAGGRLQWDLWRWRASTWHGPMRLETPAQTRDVLMIPGASRWAFLFRPAPSTPESQPVLGFRIVDSAEIERRLG